MIVEMKTCCTVRSLYSSDVPSRRRGRGAWRAADGAAGRRGQRGGLGGARGQGPRAPVQRASGVAPNAFYRWRTGTPGVMENRLSRYPYRRPRACTGAPVHRSSVLASESNSCGVTTVSTDENERMHERVTRCTTMGERRREIWQETEGAVEPAVYPCPRVRIRRAGRKERRTNAC